MKLLFQSIVDMREANSLITKLRRKRFALFQSLLSQVPRPVRILDVGGTSFFWHMMGFAASKDVRITLLNIGEPEAAPPYFESLTGNACDMRQFRDQEFDVVFSNSVIEHVGDESDQRRMVAELKRVGRRYFVQTPNKYFPLEPHFFFPGFQFLPIPARIWLVQHFALGWYPKMPDYTTAHQAVEQIRLLSVHDLRRLFPEGTLYKEKSLGLTVSFVVYAGWDRDDKVMG
jgi:methyltransferase family protein